MADRDFEPDQIERAHELRRQARVLSSGVLGLAGNTDLAAIIARAAAASGFPFAAISIVDRARLWLAVAYGFDPREFDRPHSFCDAAIAAPDLAPLCVPDAWRAPQFRFAPAVLEMGVRAYYAAPLVTHDGFALGTLCLLDSAPRAETPQGWLAELVTLASEAARVIERDGRARANAARALVELCTRLQKAVADGDELAVAILDAEIRRLEAAEPEAWS